MTATAAGFVGLLSLANMGGRFVWSTVSDKVGRKPIYSMYLGLGAVLYAILATGLWIIVGSLLAYGVAMTAIKAVQLFS